MAQLVLPSQLRGRRHGAARMVPARRGGRRLPRFAPVAEDVQGYTRALTQELGALDKSGRPIPSTTGATPSYTLTCESQQGEVTVNMGPGEQNARWSFDRCAADPKVLRAVLTRVSDGVILAGFDRKAQAASTAARGGLSKPVKLGLAAAALLGVVYVATRGGKR